jgi:hypothetical protein
MLYLYIFFISGKSIFEWEKRSKSEMQMDLLEFLMTDENSK